jgi:hypothetical protein
MMAYKIKKIEIKHSGKYPEVQWNKKPTKKDIDTFFTKAFGHKPRKDYYIQEWYGRFESPRRVWSASDYDRRQALQEMYPEKFGGLDKDTNLNNQEYQIKKYDEW